MVEGGKTDISIVMDRCSVGDQGAQDLFHALQQDCSSLRNLSLRKNRVARRGGLALAQLLRRSSALERVRLFRNSVDNRVGDKILRLKTSALIGYI